MRHWDLEGERNFGEACTSLNRRRVHFPTHLHEASICIVHGQWTTKGYKHLREVGDAATVHVRIANASCWIHVAFAVKQWVETFHCGIRGLATTSHSELRGSAECGPIYPRNTLHGPPSHGVHARTREWDD